MAIPGRYLNYADTQIQDTRDTIHSSVSTNNLYFVLLTIKTTSVCILYAVMNSGFTNVKHDDRNRSVSAEKHCTQSSDGI